VKLDPALVSVRDDIVIGFKLKLKLYCQKTTVCKIEKNRTKVDIEVKIKTGLKLQFKGL